MTSVISFVDVLLSMTSKEFLVDDTQFNRYSKYPWCIALRCAAWCPFVVSAKAFEMSHECSDLCVWVLQIWLLRSSIRKFTSWHMTSCSNLLVFFRKYHLENVFVSDAILSYYIRGFFGLVQRIAPSCLISVRVFCEGFEMSHECNDLCTSVLQTGLLRSWIRKLAYKWYYQSILLVLAVRTCNVLYNKIYNAWQ